MYNLFISLRNGNTASFGPYPEYPITDLKVGPDGSILSFAWKSPNYDNGDKGPTLAYVALDEIVMVAVQDVEQPLPKGLPRKK